MKTYKRTPLWVEYLRAGAMCVGMLLIMFLVFYGTWWLIVDTGRAIVHP